VIKKKPLIYGSLYKFDGYVSTFNVLQNDGNYSVNLRDAFPKMATDVPNCEEAGTLNSIVSLIASQQVNEVLKLVTGIGKPLTNELLIYNSLNNSQLKMQLQNVVSKSEIKTIFENETYFDASCEVQNPDWLISSLVLKSEIDNKNLEVISVLENLQSPFKIDKEIPIKQLNVDEFEVDTSKKYVLVCQKGITSYKATQILKERFPKANILSLAGGINDY
jgi:adenylyltransferase/sulfurtransferase